MRRTGQIVGVLAALGAATCASAETYNKTMVAGSNLRLGGFASVTADCKFKGMPAIKVVDGPWHGYFTLQEGMVSSDFQDRVQPKCNKVKVRGLEGSYQPKQDFKGTDNFTLDITYAGGVERKEAFTIDVR